MSTFVASNVYVMVSLKSFREEIYLDPELHESGLFDQRVVLSSVLNMLAAILSTILPTIGLRITRPTK